VTATTTTTMSGRKGNAAARLWEIVTREGMVERSRSNKKHTQLRRPWDPGKTAGWWGSFSYG
jgi:hypothetical protein